MKTKKLKVIPCFLSPFTNHQERFSIVNIISKRWKQIYCCCNKKWFGRIKRKKNIISRWFKNENAFKLEKKKTERNSSPPFFSHCLKPRLPNIGGKERFIAGRIALKKYQPSLTGQMHNARASISIWTVCIESFRYQSHIWKGRMNNMQRCNAKLPRHMHQWKNFSLFVLFQLLGKKKKKNKREREKSRRHFEFKVHSYKWYFRKFLYQHEVIFHCQLNPHCCFLYKTSDWQTIDICSQMSLVFHFIEKENID